MDEREYIRQLADEAWDTVDMLSSRRKGERERRAVAAFLRCLGVDLRADELIKPEHEPPDVVFRDAAFEVMIVLDEGRRMHADWKGKASQRNSMQAIGDLAEPYHPRVLMPWRETISLVASELRKKASHYGPRTCSQLDAMLYINLLGRDLCPLPEVHVPDDLRSQGWRSVCVLFPPCSCVLFATPKAPVFLRQHEGSTRHECRNWEVAFDL